MKLFKVAFALNLLLCFGTNTLAQTIQGPNPVNLNSTHTYSYTSTYLLLAPSWTILRGSVVSQSQSGLTYYVTVNWTSAGSGRITLFEDDGFGKNMMVTQRTITVNNCSISAPSVTAASRCGTGSVTLTASAGIGGSSVRWYNALTGGTLLSTGTSYATPSISMTTTYYAVTYNSTNGCESSPRTPVTATINPVPGQPAPTHGSRCGQGSITLSATPGSNGNSVRWYNASSEGTLLHTGTTYTTPSISTTTTYYIASYNTSTTCESPTPRTPITATVNSIPVSAAVSGNQRFGEGTFTLTASGAPSGGTYKWYSASSVVLGTGSTYITPIITSTSSNYLYAVAVSSSGCESAPTWVTLNVYPQPVITSNNPHVIMGATVTLLAQAGFDQYTWKDSQGGVVGSGQTFNTATPDDYTVTVHKSGIYATSESYRVKSQFESINMNFIVSDQLIAQIKDVEEIDDLPVESRNQAIQYFDELGRPHQTVMTQGSPLGKDIVQVTVYDALGREHRKYLPVVVDAEDGFYKGGIVDGNGNFAGQALNFYNNGWSDKIADDNKPFAETIFERSPLNRVLKQGAQGEVWQPDGTHGLASLDKTVKAEYLLNTASDNVLKWTYTPPTTSPDWPLGMVNAGTSLSPVYFQQGYLYKSITQDENRNQTIEFKDKLGRVILKRVQEGQSTFADTYYIYDTYSNLVCVIPPEAISRLATEFYHPASSNGSKDDFLDQWAFRYVYDGRNRMIIKQMPGNKPIYMVYDGRDRLVLIQDGNQRLNSQWHFTKYDVMNRPVMTGIYTAAGTRDNLQTQVNNFYAQTPSSSWAWFETFTTQAGHVHGYNNKSFPQVSDASLYLTITYYDNYLFTNLVSGLGYASNNLSVTTSYGEFLQPSTPSKALGQVTGAKVKILGSSTFLYTASYYDDKYRVIQTIAQNHKSGTDRVSNLYDFTGKILKTRRTYVVNGVTRYVEETFDYDHAGRLLTVKHSTNGATPIMTVKNEYNELGELIDKKLHSTDNGVTFKQSVDYRYNIRGWLAKINEADVSTLASGETLEDYFGMELAYNDALSGITSSATYNGNISAVKWSTGALGGANLQGYHYNYDRLNRLETSGHYKDKLITGWGSDNANLETDFTYDLNGNIGGFKRRGADASLIDNLEYGYTGNRLNFVHDTGDAIKGFVNGNTGTDDYTYDDNGNMTVDKNKGITAITYNHLNLPVQVNKGTNDYIVYTYDATGRKLAQQVYGATPKRTDYIGEMVFEGTTPVLKIINHTEGRILPDGANWEYQYHLTDHLGNVRVTFTTKTQTAVTKSANFETTSNADFTNYTRTGYDLVDHTDPAGTTYTYVQHLNGGANGRVGVGRSMAVMPGDKVSIGAYAKYMNLGPTTNLTPLINSLASAFGTSSSATGELGKLYNGLNSYAGMVVGGDHPDDDETAPKAFVTILLFDKEYNLVDAAWKQITTTGLQTSSTVKQPPHDYLFKEVTVAEPGFAYVFISNEHPTYVDIYFDDVTVTHTPSPIVSSSDYYAFGMQHTTGERVGSWEQKYLYNGKELQDELNLGWLDYGARMYMPDIGRWGVTDPLAEVYQNLTPFRYAFNNPINVIDPNGMIEALGQGQGDLIYSATGSPDIIKPEISEIGLSQKPEQPTTSLGSGKSSDGNSKALAICPDCPSGAEYDIYRQSNLFYNYDERVSGDGVYLALPEITKSATDEFGGHNFDYYNSFGSMLNNSNFYAYLYNNAPSREAQGALARASIANKDATILYATIALAAAPILAGELLGAATTMEVSGALGNLSRQSAQWVIKNKDWLNKGNWWRLGKGHNPSLPGPNKMNIRAAWGAHEKYINEVPKALRPLNQWLRNLGGGHKHFPNWKP